MLLNRYAIINSPSYHVFHIKKTRLYNRYSNLNLTFLTLSELAVYFRSVALKVPSCLLNSGTVVNLRGVQAATFIAKYIMNSGLLTKCLTKINAAINVLMYKEARLGLQVLLGENNLLVKNGVLQSVRSLNQPSRHLLPLELLQAELTSLKPLFHFYIYKVDKQIYKNSRGKSGKYTFLWKYLPPFKRLNFITSKLSKDVKFDSAKTLERRLINSFMRYIYSVKTTLAYKSIKFSSNYVFYNARTTLLSNYRTIKSA